ncbi:DUF72 domain-containing protein [Qipengyuania sediminis]|uniref:DUF72 domain-containing protein n=1 Tax=Qipengyuania sediminis TaxID=1532023 RepID=UPI001059804C|nr:DUF72 domain-containing protein [Qipengyuania sediminis]
MPLPKIGTAGWSIPRSCGELFLGEGSALERYARRFAVAEINSSFHRSHRASTWERWRDSTPPGFCFSAKLPKLITHQLKLVDFDGPLIAFLEEAHCLGPKLAVLLVQLPPKLVFDAEVAQGFFTALSERTDATVVCEPRHASWFTSEANDLLVAHKVARAAADPAVCESAAVPGGWLGLHYWRLHGSPVIYRSSYADRIPELARALAKGDSPIWCIFDNTASSAATADALALMAAVSPASPGRAARR